MDLSPPTTPKSCKMDLDDSFDPGAGVFQHKHFEFALARSEQIHVDDPCLTPDCKLSVPELPLAPSKSRAVIPRPIPFATSRRQLNFDDLPVMRDNSTQTRGQVRFFACPCVLLCADSRA